jgi:hypothetical protein
MRLAAVTRVDADAVERIVAASDRGERRDVVERFDAGVDLFACGVDGESADGLGRFDLLGLLFCRNRALTLAAGGGGFFAARFFTEVPGR